MIEFPLIFVIWVGFAILVGIFASNWGRSFILWTLVALVGSPLLAAVILAFAGKTVAQRATELREIQARVNGTYQKPPLIDVPAPSVMAKNLGRFMLKIIMVVGVIVFIGLVRQHL